MKPAAITVLVVDDNENFRRAAAAVLHRAAGFALVGEAADGREAVVRAAQLRPDLVLMDVRMPGIDGLAASRAIVDTTPHVRVVLCSTYELADLPEQVARSGAVAYLAKADLTPTALRDLWERFTGVPGAATPPAAMPPN